MRFYLFPLLIILHEALAETNCTYGKMNEMYNKTSVRETHGDLVDTYYSNCTTTETCSADVEYISTTTKRDFRSLARQVDVVNQYIQLCLQGTSDICTANLKYEITTGEANQNILEKQKPYCFPSTCLESDFELLDPYLTLCTAAGENCKPTLVGLRCPENRTVSTEGNCADDVPGRFDQLSLRARSVNTAMDGMCAAAAAGQNNQHCRVERSDPAVATSSDFSEMMTKPSFKTFAQTCVQEGGLQCEVSYSLVTAPQSEGIKLTDERTNMPICIPSSCVEKEVAAAEIILKELSAGSTVFQGVGNLGLSPNSNVFQTLSQAESVCILNPTACSVDIKSLSCANSPAYIEPTISPTVYEEPEVEEPIADVEPELVEDPVEEAPVGLQDSLASGAERNYSLRPLFTSILFVAIALIV